MCNILGVGGGLFEYRTHHVVLYGACLEGIYCISSISVMSCRRK